MIVLGLMIFLAGLIGFIVNPKSLIQLILSLELLIIGASQVVLQGSIILNDLDGELLTVFWITLAGSESAIALAILVSYYQLRGSIRVLP